MNTLQKLALFSFLGTFVPGLLFASSAEAKFFDVEGFAPSLTAPVTNSETAAFLYQPSPPAGVVELPLPLGVISESGLTTLLAPNPQTASGERQEIVTYLVAEGDTPSAIASQFGVTLSTLLWANKLTERSLIRPGQELVILPVSGVRHEVRRGDTIASIAKRYQADVDDITSFNDLPLSGEIFVGDALVIPGGKLPSAPPPRQSYRRIIQPSLAVGFFVMPAVGRNLGRLHGFNAVDIANACGTPIYSSAAGTVAIADASGWNGGYGKYVRVRHLNGVETTYAHMRSVAMRVGQALGQGDYLGEMGTTGRSTGCHVHFEVRGARNPFAK